MNPNDIVHIYFDICTDNDTLEIDLFATIKQLETMLSPYIVGSSISNEGHDCDDNLVCCFIADKSKLALNNLYQFIERNHGGGDDILYLTTNNLPVAVGNFQIVDRPGMTKPVPFEDWDEYIDDLLV